jgi:hypothetical protein
MVEKIIPSESGSNWDLSLGVLPYLLEWFILSLQNKD